MYYVHLQNATYGPYTLDQVRQMSAAGQVSSNTLVLEQGGKQQWLPALNFPEIFKKPSGKHAAARNPVATSIPVNPGSVENTIWHGSPSIWTILDRLLGPTFLTGAVLAAAAVLWPRIPQDGQHVAVTAVGGFLLLFMLWFACQWILLKTVSWTLSTERITWKQGLLSRKIHNLELYRIKDISLRKPLLMRLVGRGYVDFVTSDQSEKGEHESIGAIPKPDDLYALLRKYVERQRQQKGVREVDFWHA